MKLTLNQKKLLVRLIERYESKINKPRIERWIDAQYEAHFIGFEPDEFHETMKLFKTKGYLSWNLGNKRRAEEGSQFDFNGKSYWVLISDSGINLAKKTREEIDLGTRRLVMPAWQWFSTVLAVVVAGLVSQIIWSKMDPTADRVINALNNVATQIHELNENFKDKHPTTQVYEPNGILKKNKTK